MGLQVLQNSWILSLNQLQFQSFGTKSTLGWDTQAREGLAN
jgi:hypothetical protein